MKFVQRSWLFFGDTSRHRLLLHRYEIVCTSQLDFNIEHQSSSYPYPDHGFDFGAGFTNARNLVEVQNKCYEFGTTSSRALNFRVPEFKARGSTAVQSSGQFGAQNVLRSCRRVSVTFTTDPHFSLQNGIHRWIFLHIFLHGFVNR